MPLCVSQQTGKFFKMGTPDHLTCLLRNLFSVQEAIVRTEHETTDFESSDVGSVPLHLVPLASNDPWRETVHDIQKMYHTYQNLRSRTLLCEPTAPPCAAELATGVF